MTKPESPSELFATLVQAIASAHTGDVRQLLTDHPILARHKAAVGATRKSAGEFYLKGIEHYLYEGDTALHVAAAAAAYGEAVAVQLVAKGAEVRAKNRHSQEPLHYAVLGTPGSLRWNPNAQTATIRLRVDFMSIVGLDAPDFRTISDFRKRHLKALGQLFKQVLHLCEKAGLVKLGHVALEIGRASCRERVCLLV